ncbi:unnamed protein product [Parnassius apollo]|uniref:(apollo) hypothetical protein n=1 Tax=Parnassius apollo TaxID=110799 RepID=A0A8S3YE96_PARAO|nr:unnamed protein product [Parnassius apollo]
MSPQIRFNDPSLTVSKLDMDQIQGKTCLRNLYKTLTNSFMDEDKQLIIVCFNCHARLIRCRRLQQQAIESNALLEQMLAGASMSIPKPHEARDEIQFTPIHHIDIRPVECDKENDCKDGIFNLASIKVEVEVFENENSKFEENCNHETETVENADDLEIDAFGDRLTDSENDLPLIAFDSKSKEKIIKKDDNDIEQYITPTNNFPEPCIKKIKSNSTDSNTSESKFFREHSISRDENQQST